MKCFSIAKQTFICWKGRHFKWFSWGPMLICQQTSIFKVVWGSSSVLPGHQVPLQSTRLLLQPWCPQRHQETVSGKNCSCPRDGSWQVHGSFQKQGKKLQGSRKNACGVNANLCDSRSTTSSNYLGHRKIFLSHFLLWLESRRLLPCTGVPFQATGWGEPPAWPFCHFQGCSNVCSQAAEMPRALSFAFCLSWQSDSVFFCLFVAAPCHPGTVPLRSPLHRTEELRRLWTRLCKADS